MEYLNASSLYMPTLTAIGFLGGMPKAPKIFNDLAKNEWFQWLMVFVLVMQGGAGGNVQLALVMVAIAYVVVKVLDMLYVGKEESYYSY